MVVAGKTVSENQRSRKNVPLDFLFERALGSIRNNFQHAFASRFASCQIQFHHPQHDGFGAGRGKSMESSPTSLRLWKVSSTATIFPGPPNWSDIVTDNVTQRERRKPIQHFDIALWCQVAGQVVRKRAFLPPCHLFVAQLLLLHIWWSTAQGTCLRIFFFLQCRIAQDSCDHVPARTSQKEEPQTFFLRIAERAIKHCRSSRTRG